MSRTMLFRKSLSPYCSSRIIDLPKFNSPTSGCSVAGDQYFPTIKDFCEFLLANGTRSSLQSPSGNLYINGINIGEYEYEVYNGISISSNYDRGGANENKNYFLISSAGIAINDNITLGPSTANKAKRLFVIYSVGIIGGNNNLGKIANKAPLTEFSSHISVIYGSVGGTGLYHHARLIPNPIGGGGNSTSASSSPRIIIGGNRGLPETSVRAGTDGTMYPGNGGSGALSAGLGAFAQSGAGQFASSIGGGGGGAGAYDEVAGSGQGIDHSGGNAAVFSINKGEPVYSTSGGGGTNIGTSVAKDGGDTLTNGTVSGGAVIIFCTGATNSLFEVATTGGSASTYASSPYVSGGGSGGGPLFIMSTNATSTTCITNGGDAGANGGIGGVGILIRANYSSISAHRWYR